MISVDTRDSLVRASERRMIATIGVEDLVIVDTPDATLVARKDRVQDVKTIVDQLKAAGRQEHCSTARSTGRGAATTPSTWASASRSSASWSSPARR